MGQIKNFDQLYPGRFLKAGHFEQPRTLRIRDIQHEELHGEKGPQLKVIISFDGEPLGLVACKTNGLCLKHLFGSNVPDWIGKRVTLFASEWNGEPCIRVWGSPELDRDEECTIQLPRRKPFTMKLRAVKQGGGKAPKPEYSEGSVATERKPDSPAAQRAKELQSKLNAATDLLSVAHVADEINAAQGEFNAKQREWLGEQLAKRQAELQTAERA